jgi:hypothetical protein
MHKEFKPVTKGVDFFLSPDDFPRNENLRFPHDSDKDEKPTRNWGGVGKLRPRLKVLRFC